MNQSNSNPRNAAEYRQWWSENTDVPYSLCWCGCGLSTPLSKETRPKRPAIKGEPMRYIFGHTNTSPLKPRPTKQCLACGTPFSDKPSRESRKYCSRQCVSMDYPTGIHARRYKGGSVKPSGYRVIIVNRQAEYEHRYIMEQHLQRKLSTNEVVHHIDGDKLNNQVHNLQVMSQSEHAALHGHH